MNCKVEVAYDGEVSETLKSSVKQFRNLEPSGEATSKSMAIATPFPGMGSLFPPLPLWAINDWARR